MRCLAVCQTELAIRMLDEILLPSFEVEFLVESKPLARRLHDSGLNVTAGDLRRTDTYLKADLTPGTCVVVEDNGQRSLKKILEAIRDAGGTLGLRARRWRPAHAQARRGAQGAVSRAELSGAVRALRRPAAHRIQPLAHPPQGPAVSALLQPTPTASLILLHNDPTRTPWPAAWRCATCCAAPSRRRCIAALQGVTRPENQRMMNLLDIHVEIITPEQIAELRPHRHGGRAAALLRRPRSTASIW